MGGRQSKVSCLIGRNSSGGANTAKGSRPCLFRVFSQSLFAASHGSLGVALSDCLRLFVVSDQ